MRRWPIVVMVVIWLGLGVLLSWAYGLGAHGEGHGPEGEVRTEQTAGAH